MSLPSQQVTSTWFTQFSPPSTTATGKVPDEGCSIRLNHGAKMTQSRATAGPQET